MKTLSLIDYLFLFLENKKQPMHIAGLCLFELPVGVGDEFISALIKHLNEQKVASFPFNHKLYRHLFWKADEDFELGRHFHHIQLAKNSSLDELLSHISAKHGQKIPKDKPLWEFYLIENIRPAKGSDRSRFAIWIKIHHSLADGVAGMRLVKQSLSTNPTLKACLPFWAMSKRSSKNTAPKPTTPKNSAIARSFGAVFPIIKELSAGLKARFDPHSPFISTFDAPKSILNQRITSTRHLSVASFDKSRFADTAKALSITTNDLLLAVCSGALRAYLMSQNALPDKPLIAFVPISLRRDDSTVGNQLSFLLANLGTHLDSAHARLHTIKQSMDDGKRRFSRLTPAQVITYSAITYGWAGINLASALVPTRQAFNLIISNVPSDNEPLYLHGAKLVGIYPASVLFDGQALNITLTNHQDQIDFGITACSTALPNIGMFLSLVADELMVFERLANTPNA